MKIEQAIKESTSFREAARKLGKPSGNQWVKKQAIELNIDFSHFQHGNIYESMIGLRFNMLTVMSIRHVKEPHRRSFALCHCDCGNDKEFRCDGLKDGRFVSCGCNSKNRWNTIASLNHQFNGVGEIRGTYFSNLKRSAARRSLEFSISIEELWQIYEQQKYLCFFTGLPIKFGRIHFPHETTASPDRIDNSKGYVSGNVRWVLKDINMIRGSYDSEYFINLCNLVANKNPRMMQP